MANYPAASQAIERDLGIKNLGGYGGGLHLPIRKQKKEGKNPFLICPLTILPTEKDRRNKERRIAMSV